MLPLGQILFLHENTMPPTAAIKDLITTVNRSANRLHSPGDVIKLLEQYTQSRHEMVGQGSTAITVAFPGSSLGESVVVRILADPAEHDPWFDGYGKYCLRRTNKGAPMAILPRVYGITRTKSVGVACLERLSGVGTLLQKVNQILPTIADESDIEHLFESMAMYLSGDRAMYMTGRENLSELLSTNNPKEITEALVELSIGLNFDVEELAALYFKVIPSLGVTDHEVDIRSGNVGWRTSTQELVIFDPVA